MTQTGLRWMGAQRVEIRTDVANRAPVADAGPDRRVQIGTLAQLDGSGSGAVPGSGGVVRGDGLQLLGALAAELGLLSDLVDDLVGLGQEVALARVHDERIVLVLMRRA